MKKWLKRGIVLLMAFMLAWGCLNLASCKETVENWVELRVYSYTSDKGAEHLREVLTQEKNRHEQYMGVYPFLDLDYGAEIAFYRKTTKKIYSHYRWRTIRNTVLLKEEDVVGTASPLDGLTIEYDILDADGNARKGKYKSQAFDLTLSSGVRRICLERTDGTHRFRYKLDKMEEYGTDAVDFEVLLNVEKDTRTKQAVIELEDETYAKYTAEQTGSYDLYILNKEPYFTARDKETLELIIPKYDSFVLDSYRKLNEYYYSNQVLLSLVGEPQGVYLCKVSFRHPDYQSLVYMCYVIILE